MTRLRDFLSKGHPLLDPVIHAADASRRPLYLRDTPLSLDATEKSFLFVGESKDQIHSFLVRHGFSSVDATALCNHTPIKRRDSQGTLHDYRLVIIPNHDPSRPTFTEPIRNLIAHPGPSEPHPPQQEPPMAKPTRNRKAPPKKATTATPRRGGGEPAPPPWAARIREARLKKPMTQEALSEAMGFKYNVVWSIEKGTRQLTDEQFSAAAHTLGVSKSWLMGFDTSPTPTPIPAPSPKAKSPSAPPEPGSEPAPARAPKAKDSLIPSAILLDAGLSPTKIAAVRDVTDVLSSPKLTDAQALRVQSLFKSLVVSVLLD